MRVTNGLDKKLQDDAVFQKRVEQNPKFESYRKLIPDMEFLYKRLEPFTKAREYYAETFVRNVDVYDYYQLVKSLINTYEGRGETKFNSSKEDVLKNVDAYFKDFNTSIDQEIFTSLLEQFIKEMNPAFVFNSLKEDLNKHKADYKAFTKALYSSSRLTNKDSLAILMALDYSHWINAVKSDPLYQFYEDMNFYQNNDINKLCFELEEQINALRRTHMTALMEVIPEKNIIRMQIQHSE